MTDSGSMTNPSEAMKPCRECAADCSVQVFDSENVKATVWMCSRHPYLRGDCPSTTAYLSRTAWNEQAATPAAPVQDDDAAIERALGAWEATAGTRRDMMRNALRAARLTPDRVTPLVEALRAEVLRLVDALVYAHDAGFQWPDDPLPFGSIAHNLFIERGNDPERIALREGTPDA